jgi:hypothetical protein
MAMTEKKEAKYHLINATKMLVNIMQAWPQMTDAKRNQLRITVRDRQPQPVPRPSTSPYLSVSATFGNTISVKIQSSKTERKRPKDVMGATLFSYVGKTPPNIESAWTYQGQTTKSVEEVSFDAALPPGTQVWFTAVWYNRRAETGPAAKAITCNLPGGEAFEKAAA